MKPTFDEIEAKLLEAEVPARRFGSIPLDLKTRPLRSGFAAMEQYDYLRAGQPDLVVVGARPGNGKTSFLVQALLNIAKNEGPTMLFSIEMAGEQLMKRAMAAESGTPIKQLHMLSPARQEAARAAIEAAPFFCDDTKGIDINTLRARAMDFNRRSKLAAVGVDYLQIVRTQAGRSRTEEVMQAVEGLKQLAHDIGAPVIALAQMSREIEKRQQLSKTARPVMSDLADCGGIERWADQILFLDGAGKYDPSRAGEVDVTAAKNRHGETRNFILRFDGATTRFSDMEEGI